MVLAASLGVGLLVKSVIGAAFPIAAGLIYLAVTRQLFSARTWKRLHPFTGALIALAIAAPWHILATLRNPLYFAWVFHSGPGEYHGFLWHYFINEQVLRFLNRRYPRDYSTVPRLWFWLLHLVWLFPWSVYFPAVAKLSFKPVDRAGRTRLLALCWVGFVLIFFTFSTTQEYYSMPCYPALALLLASAMAAGGDWVRRGTRVLCIVSACAAIAVFSTFDSRARRSHARRHLLRAQPPSRRLQTLAGPYAGSDSRLVRVSSPSSRDCRSRVLDRYVRNALGKQPTRIPGRGPHDGFVLSRRAPGDGGVRPLSIIAAAGNGIVTSAPGNADRTSSLLRILVCFLLYESHGAFADRPPGESQYGSYAPGAPTVFINDKEFQQYWQAPERCYLFTYQADLPRYQQMLGPASLNAVATSGGKILLTNQPLTYAAGAQAP